jgi:hypothetical protein
LLEAANFCIKSAQKEGACRYNPNASTNSKDTVIGKEYYTFDADTWDPNSKEAIKFRKKMSSRENNTSNVPIKKKAERVFVSIPKPFIPEEYLYQQVNIGGHCWQSNLLIEAAKFLQNESP